MALIFFVILNLVAIGSVLFSHHKKWRVDLTRYRHYTALIFNVCGITYALFLGFVIWDVWERHFDVKQTIQEEGKYLIDLYRNAKVFPQKEESAIQDALKAYMQYMVDVEWHESLKEGDHYINAIWDAYYDYVPENDYERIWYTESLDKLSELTNTRMTRLFNRTSSVGPLRWILLILGAIVLVMIPCFFKVDYFVFKLVLTLFLANIIAFMLFIIYSLDHPFSGFERLKWEPYEYALESVESW